MSKTSLCVVTSSKTHDAVLIKFIGHHASLELVYVNVCLSVCRWGSKCVSRCLSVSLGNCQRSLLTCQSHGEKPKGCSLP